MFKDLDGFDVLPWRKSSLLLSRFHAALSFNANVACGGKLRLLMNPQHTVLSRTGMKCLPAAKLPQASGTAIHDWHAEVLAIRAFNYFVLEECRRLSLGDEENSASDFIRRRNDAEINYYERGNPETSWHGQPFTWRDDVSLYMYCSEAPCMSPFRVQVFFLSQTQNLVITHVHCATFFKSRRRC